MSFKFKVLIITLILCGCEAEVKTNTPPITATDSILASQMCSIATGGTSYNGVAGTATCQSTSGGTNATAANVLAGTYYWNSAGTSTVGTLTDRGSAWDLTTAFPGAGYYGGISSALTTSSVCNTSNFLGSTGTAVCNSTVNQLIPSNVYRDVVTAQLTRAQEDAAGALGAGYHEIPNSNTDDDGYWTSANGCTGAGGGSNTCTPVIHATHGHADCGTSGTIAARITNCNFTWNGMANGIGGESIWQLVSSISGKEVWKDTKTGLLWSDLMGTDTWCTAAGSSQTNEVSNYCAANTVSYCSEGTGINAASGSENWTTPTYANEKGGMGKNSTTVVRWRLPNRSDWYQAEVDGVRFVLQSMVGNDFWTTTIYSNFRQVAWIFKGSTGDATSNFRHNTYKIRCVGR